MERIAFQASLSSGMKKACHPSVGAAAAGLSDPSLRRLKLVHDLGDETQERLPYAPG